MAGIPIDPNMDATCPPIYSKSGPACKEIGTTIDLRMEKA